MIKEFARLNPKTTNLSGGGTGGTPDLEWTDIVCAIPQARKEFVNLFMGWANNEDRNRIINFMSHMVEMDCLKKKIQPRRTPSEPDMTLKKMCRAIAKMALQQFEHPKVGPQTYTIVERLVYGGINPSNPTMWDEKWGKYDRGLLKWLDAYCLACAGEAAEKMKQIRMD
ncbi:MAG: hypothetical protein KGI50_07645 [Patescibacteria group bacterium]|nr:hypothetical protein [Patescibacteria group bacterium]